MSVNVLKQKDLSGSGKKQVDVLFRTYRSVIRKAVNSANGFYSLKKFSLNAHQRKLVKDYLTDLFERKADDYGFYTKGDPDLLIRNLDNVGTVSKELYDGIDHDYNPKFDEVKTEINEEKAKIDRSRKTGFFNPLNVDEVLTGAVGKVVFKMFDYLSSKENKSNFFDKHK